MRAEEHGDESLGGSEPWGVTVELIRRFKGGDTPALNQIFERYYERVYRIVRIEFQTGKYAWLGRRVATADIVQDTFIKALEIFDRFEMKEPASLVRWLVKIAKNKIRDEADRHAAGVRDVGREVSIDSRRDGSHSRFDLAASGILPRDLLQRAEEVEVVDQCVAELPEDWRQVIIRRYYEGGSWDYVAQEMGRSLGAVQMLHKRARERLFEMVARQLDR